MSALNILGGADMKLRQGDALKLTVAPGGVTSGTYTVTIPGVTSYVASVGSDVIHTFSSAGSFTVQGQQGGYSDSLTVTVYDSVFPTNAPACVLGSQRNWSCPDLDGDVVVEADDTVTLGRNGTTLQIEMSNISDPHYAVARVETDGAILDSVRLDGFWVQAAVDNYMWVVERYDDCQLWEQRIVTKALPASVDIRLSIFIAGVMFEDATIERWIDASDLDELEEYTFRLIHPNSVQASACHTIYIYQDGEYLGEAYYGGTLPVE